MEQLLLSSLDLGISKSQWQEAYDYLYEEFGFTITLWSHRKLEREIINYWSDRDE